MRTLANSGLTAVATLGLITVMAGTPVSAQADEVSNPTASDPKASAQSALAKRTDKRNLVQYAGSPPQWIKAPHLANANGKRLAITAKVYAVPVPAKRASRPGRLHFRVTVAKKSASSPQRPASLNLLPDSAVLMRTEKTVKVSQRGVLTLKQMLTKKASRQLSRATHLQRRARVAVSVSHWKDTKPGGVWDLKQITTGDLAKREDPAPLQRKRTKTAKLQHKVNSGKKQWGCPVLVDILMVGFCPADEDGIYGCEEEVVYPEVPA